MAESEKQPANRETGNASFNENPSLELNPRPQEEEFKEGGYGWSVPSFKEIDSSHYAVFLAYYLRNGTFGTTLLVSPLATSLVGWKRCGTRLTVFIGVVIGFIGSSFATELWHILLSQGISFGLGMGLCFVASAAVPPQWFVKRRSFANAIAASGSGFGGLCYSLATNAMISRIGLPWTFRVLAIICFVVNGIASFFIRDRNEALGSVHVAFNWKLFKRPPFLMFQAWMSLSLIAYTILLFSIVDYCQSVGLSASQASLIGALFNLSQGLGRPVIGLSSDSVGRLNIANLCTLFCGLLCMFFWIFGARSLASCIVFALLGGSVAGVIWATVAPICAEVVGIALIPSALSMTWLVLVLPATFAEVIAVGLRRSGPWGYLHVQIFTASLYLGAFIFGWALRAWKVWELEQAHLTKEQQELAIRDDGVLSSFEPEPQANGQRPATRRRRRLSVVKGLWVIERV
ncbi:hypothetical protein AAE478_002452 [Parahypoxylon ruwenzoriense]